MKITKSNLCWGPNKTDVIIKQIRKDHHLLKLKGKKNDTVVLGFINSDNIQNKNHFNSLKNKCIVYGIKNGILCGKEIIFPIDWKIEKNFRYFSRDVNKRLDDLDKKFGELKQTINKIKNNEKQFFEKIKKKNILGYEYYLFFTLNRIIINKHFKNKAEIWETFFVDQWTSLALREFLFSNFSAYFIQIIYFLFEY